MSPKIIEGKVIQGSYGKCLVLDSQSGIEFLLYNNHIDSVLDGDLVRAQVIDIRSRSKGRALVKLLEVIARPRKTIMARYVKKNAKDYVIPCSLRIQRQIKLINKPADIPDDCILEIKLQAKKDLKLKRLLKGEILKVVGSYDDATVEVDLAIGEYALPNIFPKKVLAETEKLPRHVVKNDKENRRSLLHLPFVTIDGSDARDYDDAVFCVREGKYWRLWIAIADVSHYVLPNSPLDKEAMQRTSSTYFPNRVIPMLPEKLSNQLCSLNPGLERLVMVCEMLIDNNGKVCKKELYSAVIYSRFRLIYEDVAALINRTNNSSSSKDKPITPEVIASLFSLHELTLVLLEEKRKRHSLNFRHLEEIRINMDEHGKIQGLYQYKRNIAHLMIEEAMLLANLCVADFLEEHKMNFCYRVHPPPEQEKLNSLAMFLNYYKIKVPRDRVDSSVYCKILEKVNKYPEAAILEMMVLKSMQQALYQVKPGGHFGLNYNSYTHFTSPIRRYPDLLVHRALKKALKDKLSKENKTDKKYTKQELGEIAEHCSQQERNINKAVWQVLDALKCRYLAKQNKKIHKGRIVYISDKGFFVRLNNIPVEGMVRATLLRDDYYRYDSNQQILQGIKHGKIFRMGNSVSVRIERIRIEERKVDFTLV